VNSGCTLDDHIALEAENERLRVDNAALTRANDKTLTSQLRMRTALEKIAEEKWGLSRAELVAIARQALEKK
jgi:hypothetical protein